MKPTFKTTKILKAAIHTLYQSKYEYISQQDKFINKCLVLLADPGMFVAAQCYVDYLQIQYYYISPQWLHILLILTLCQLSQRLTMSRVDHVLPYPQGRSLTSNHLSYTLFVWSSITAPRLEWLKLQRYHMTSPKLRDNLFSWFNLWPLLYTVLLLKFTKLLYLRSKFHVIVCLLEK